MQNDYFLFLDDIRNPKEVTWERIPFGVQWDIVRNYDKFVKTVEEKGLPVFVTFDHDLADEHYPKSSEDYLKGVDSSKFREKTGFDCAKWMVEYCEENALPFPEFRCHSMNPVGKKNIVSYIASYKKSKDLA